jgi:hypothetical protein
MSVSLPATLSPVSAPVPTGAPAPVARRQLADLLAPLDRLAAGSANLVADRSARFTVGETEYALPSYVFVGPHGGDTPVHIGIFAGIHGDEPEGVHAVVQFIQLLEARPELATGYHLTFYPACNPTGLEAGTRHSRSGHDLNREFWRNSPLPEIQLLEADLRTRAFQGLIALHTDDTSDGFYGFVRGATLTRHLIEPALAAAEKFLPRNTRPVIDGFAARRGVIRECYEGVLSAPPLTRSRPFELILETPAAPPEYLKQCAFVSALQTILVEYQKLMAYAPNL